MVLHGSDPLNLIEYKILKLLGSYSALGGLSRVRLELQYVFLMTREKYLIRLLMVIDYYWSIASNHSKSPVASFLLGNVSAFVIAQSFLAFPFPSQC